MSAINTAIAPYSTLELTGIMTAALIGALLVIAFAFRVLRTMATVRQYEAACEQVTLIEAKLEEMRKYMESLERQFEKDMADTKQLHAKERFELQQTIFTRNSEILDLKHKLLEVSQASPYAATFSQ